MSEPLFIYRHRKSHLATFLFNMHPFLIQQNLDYRIFVLEQKGTFIEFVLVILT